MGHEENGTGYQQQPDAHKLCANGCGFFGTAATLNLCSKCYRDHRIKEEQSASVKAAMEKSLNPKISVPSTTTTTTAASQPQLIVTFSAAAAAAAAAVAVDSTSSSSSSGNLGKPSVKSDSGVRSRCCSCNKRVGLTGFKCKCGSTYCSAHRYPEEHSCTFDFKSVGRDSIAKANPVVKAEKLEKF